MRVFNQKYILIASADSTISIFDRENNKILNQRIFNENISGINCIEIYNQLLFIGCEEKLLIFRIDEISDENICYQLLKLQPFKNSIITSFTKTEQYIFVTTDTAMIYVISTIDLSPVLQDFSHQDIIISSQICNYNDQQLLMTFDINKRLLFYNVETLTLKFTCTLPQLASAITYDEQNNLLYAQCKNEIIIYKLCDDKIQLIKEIKNEADQTAISNICLDNDKLYFYDKNILYYLNLENNQTYSITGIPQDQIISNILLINQQIFIGTNFGVLLILKE